MTSSPLAMTTPIAPRVTPTIFAPNVSQLAMSDDERRVMGHLAELLLDPNYQAELKVSGLYYDGLNAVPSLGISVPPELETLRGVLGWCQAGVDARSERLTPMGFRMPGATEVDDELQAIWQANNLDAEAPIVHDASMIYRHSYVIVGKRDEGDELADIPLITSELPENMIGSWDIRTRSLSAAFQTYVDIDPASPTYLRQLATFYNRLATVQLAASEKGWVVQARNDHNQGFVPVQMFAHKPSIKNRYGSSAMNAAWRNTQDRACRTLVRAEVAGEFFATLKIIILGVTESSFRKSDGSLATAWETFMGRLSTLKADEDGNLPEVKEIRGDSPDGFISSLDKEAQIMSGHTGLAPAYLGIHSDGNPSSADAIRMSDFRLKTIADKLSVTFGDDWESVMRMAMRMIGGFDMAAAARMETDWAYTGIPTPNADAVTVATQIEARMIPPTSDDALAKTGWTPVQRKRIEAERKRFQGLAELDGALDALKPPGGQPAQALDGEQPGALAGLNSARTTDGANAG